MPGDRMEATMGLGAIPDTRSTSFNQKAAVVWLEQQPENLQSSLAAQIFEDLLSMAAQPRQFSGSACSKMCGFVENCSKSASSELSDFAFAHARSIQLFNYFIEWNEQDAHRSMRLALDYIVSSIRFNPDVETSKTIKHSMIFNTVSVMTLEASKPSTKSSMIALDHFLQKKVIYMSEVLEIYNLLHDSFESEQDSFVSRIFAWMENQTLWTVAGKLIVTMFTQPCFRDDKLSKPHPNTWHKPILAGLSANPELLEAIKVYIFIPLFRTDPTSTLTYLDELTSLQRLTTNDSESWDLNAMLWVALLEAGKKTGVVAEPDYDGSKKNMDLTKQLPSHVMDTLLCHKSHEARASGMSILIASPSTTKPYAPETLDLLQKYLPSFHEDVDPKIRYDVLGHTRNMIRRLHNAIGILRREPLHKSKTSDEKERGHGYEEPEKTLKTEHTSQTQQVPTQSDVGIKASTDILCEHEKFVEWYTNFLKDELMPTASYQRHITSLRAMNYFLKTILGQNDASSITQWPTNLLVDDVWFRSVLDLVLDPYDDVREIATSLIMSLQTGGPMSGPPDSIHRLGSTPIAELRVFCQKANELALKTARADHCDGAARSNQLLCRWSSNFDEALEVLKAVCSSLVDKTCWAEQDLANAVLQAPVHGDFASLGYIWSTFSGVKYDKHQLTALDEFQNQAISCCQRIWRAVRHILCDDSPEGHLPEELQQIEGLDTKDLLSYSFRAIHESSNLLRTIAQNARHDRKQGFLAPTRQNYEDIGNLTFDELSNLRHRGAFSTVSQTFTVCCSLEHCIPYGENEGVDLLQQWYEGALNCIYTQASTTRRSAGIPAIIVGILASKSDSPSFDEVMVKLQSIARQPAYVSETDGSNLAQVHALNCLKDIFKTSFLSNIAEAYLTDCLKLAAASLQSEVWAIRNCGLLLLRSLIDILIGTNENKTATEAGWDGRTVRISYHKYEALPSLLVDLLELGKESSGITLGTQRAEAVFPALDIIRRAGPPEGYSQKLFGIITWYLGSHIWHVREIAARTICSLLLSSNWLQSIQSLIRESGESSNKLHGALLTLRFLLERLLEVMPDELSERNVTVVYEILGNLSASNSRLRTCTEAQAVYVDILNFLETTCQTKPDGLRGESINISSPQDSDQASLALLNIRGGETIVRQALRKMNEEATNALDEELKVALAADINVACAMLETLSSSELPQTDEALSRFATVYLNVCFETEAPEPRTTALEGFASLIDTFLKSASPDDTLSTIPTEETLRALWLDLRQKPINASLLDAIIRISGPLIAISLTRAQGKIDDSLAQQLSCWGSMMSDAGMADRTFDTRIAAVEAIRSLSMTVKLPTNNESNNAATQTSSAHLPWLLALYDALTDDDIDVREAAADAANPVLGSALVPVEAGALLLRWLAARFQHDPNFQMHVVGRIAGHNFGSCSFIASTDATEVEGNTVDTNDGSDWIAAKAQLAEAMRFDDSLFVIEEHNQYIDEVREAKRWADVFRLSTSGPENTGDLARSKAFQALAKWTLAGLRALSEIVQAGSEAGGDGPLGWTAKPQVFAICARVLICASALAGSEGTGRDQDQEQEVARIGEEMGVREEVAQELSRFWNLGRGDGARVHGLLLKMSGLET
ncbi:putative death-receptor fusion protein-domain-containing protein [Astrocystis sublimbata]|nr:putative death-receptor fusion protein-domain-containing protein [Astrocystis sublimbata]